MIPTPPRSGINTSLRRWRVRVCVCVRACISRETFLGYRTNAYRMHYFETASGLKFILTTDAATASMREALQRIYSQCYVEFVAKNPLSRLEDKIDNELFVKSLDRLVRSLPAFQGQ